MTSTNVIPLPPSHNAPEREPKASHAPAIELNPKDFKSVRLNRRMRLEMRDAWVRAASPTQRKEEHNRKFISIAARLVREAIKCPHLEASLQHIYLADKYRLAQPGAHARFQLRDIPKEIANAGNETAVRNGALLYVYLGDLDGKITPPQPYKSWVEVVYGRPNVSLNYHLVSYTSDIGKETYQYLADAAELKKLEHDLRERCTELLDSCTTTRQILSTFPEALQLSPDFFPRVGSVGTKLIAVDPAREAMRKFSNFSTATIVTRSEVLNRNDKE